MTGVGGLLLVALAGGVGSAVRHLVGRALDRERAGGRSGGLPWGTLLVNLVASAALGALVAADLPPGVLAVLGVGLCGGLSTYSAFAVQTAGLTRERRWSRAAAYVLVTVAGSLLAATVGWAVAGVALGTS